MSFIYLYHLFLLLLSHDLHRISHTIFKTIKNIKHILKIGISPFKVKMDTFSHKNIFNSINK